MRNVVYLLLVANLLYLGWNLSRTGEEADPGAGWPALPDSASSLVTLKEIQQRSAAAPAEASVPVTETAENPGAVDASLQPELLTRSEPPGAGQPACQALGPFSVRAELRSVAGRLRDLGMEVREQADDPGEEDGYWVYLPAGQPAAVSEVVALLERQGDRDYFVGRGNYISLGIYSEQGRAEQRREQLRQLGLEPRLAPRHTQEETWWLEFRKPSGTVLTDIIARYPELQLQARACP